MARAALAISRGSWPASTISRPSVSTPSGWPRSTFRRRWTTATTSPTTWILIPPTAPWPTSRRCWPPPTRATFASWWTSSSTTPPPSTPGSSRRWGTKAAPTATTTSGRIRWTAACPTTGNPSLAAVPGSWIRPPASTTCISLPASRRISTGRTLWCAPRWRRSSTSGRTRGWTVSASTSSTSSPRISASRATTVAMAAASTPTGRASTNFCRTWAATCLPRSVPWRWGRCPPPVWSTASAMARWMAPSSPWCSTSTTSRWTTPMATSGPRRRSISSNSSASSTTGRAACTARPGRRCSGATTISRASSPASVTRANIAW